MVIDRVWYVNDFTSVLCSLGLTFLYGCEYFGRFIINLDFGILQPANNLYISQRLLLFVMTVVLHYPMYFTVCE